MSYFKLPIMQEKQRLYEQARLCELKANNCTNLKQATKLRYKADELRCKANTLLHKRLIKCQ